MQQADKRQPEATAAAVSQPTQKFPIDFNFTDMRAGVMPEANLGAFAQFPMQGASIPENQSLPLHLKLPDEESLWEDIEDDETDGATIKKQVEPKPVARALPWVRVQGIQAKQKLRQRDRKLNRASGPFRQADKKPSPDANSLQFENKL